MTDVGAGPNEGDDFGPNASDKKDSDMGPDMPKNQWRGDMGPDATGNSGHAGLDKAGDKGDDMGPEPGLLAIVSAIGKPLMRSWLSVRPTACRSCERSCSDRAPVDHAAPPPSVVFFLPTRGGHKCRWP